MPTKTAFLIVIVTCLAETAGQQEGTPPWLVDVDPAFSSSEKELPPWLEMLEQYKENNDRRLVLPQTDLLAEQALTWANLQVKELYNQRRQRDGPNPWVSFGRHRQLQEDPMDVCNLYNQAFNGVMKCGCERYGRKDTHVLCSYTTEQCNENSTACFTGTLELFLNENGDSEAVTSCINVTRIETLLHTCIRVFPQVEGNYSQIANCSATLNGEKCNYCWPCATAKAGTSTTSDVASPASTTDSNGTVTPTEPTLTIDCCNVEQDKKQTCESGKGIVTENGATFANFEYVPEDKTGQCKGSYGYSAGTIYTRMPVMGNGGSLAMWWLILLSTGTTMWLLSSSSSNTLQWS